MAVSVKDGNGSTVTLKSSTSGSDQVPHHNVDNTPGTTPIGVVSIQTSATGSSWVSFSSQAARRIELHNTSGTDLEVRRGSEAGLLLASGQIGERWVVSNANEISIRRVDTSNTQVTIKAEIFS